MREVAGINESLAKFACFYEKNVTFKDRFRLVYQNERGAQSNELNVVDNLLTDCFHKKNRLPHGCESISHNFFSEKAPETFWVGYTWPSRKEHLDGNFGVIEKTQMNLEPK